MKNLIKIKSIVFLIGFFIFVFSFFTNDFKQTNFSEGNIIFVLDVSNSMNVEDVFYNNHLVSRLELAKKIIENNVDNIKKPFGLIVFSDTFNYFIPPTLDVKTYITYLKTLNTNILNGGNMNFVKSFQSIQEVLNSSDTLIVMSDFDTDEDFKKIKLKNYTYTIGIGTKSGGIVKDKNGGSLYKNGKLLNSLLNKNKLKEFNANKYKVIDSYNKGEVLDVLKNFKNKNLIDKNDKINYLEIVGFAFMILCF